MNLSKVEPHQDHLNFKYLIARKININSLEKKILQKNSITHTHTHTHTHTQSFTLNNRHICNMHFELQTFAINILILC